MFDVLGFIPNLITLLNLQFGFFSIISCISIANNSYTNFTPVYIYHIGSVVFDFMDGKIARLLKKESKIGEQLDSLSDMVSFVVVPVLLGYTKYGLLLPNSFYLLCGCYRLARFNVSHSLNSFEGLPTPVACCVVLLTSYLEFNKNQLYYLYLFLAGLMISKISIKKI
jgi:CDP-diacylglycerol--serine O-phosphatidyltransferase